MKTSPETIKVWPEMVLRETLAAVIATIGLLLISLYIDAPLEAVADPAVSPNPAKAPWYFLGLQELLVYFPPWIAGVLIPVLIILGLAAVPYLDINQPDMEPEDFVLERTLRAIFTGGLLLWIILTLTGLFLRGPNWHLQWPNGAAMGAAPVIGSPTGPALLVAAGYGLAILVRLRRFRKARQALGPWRCLLSHAMALGGLIIVVRIIQATLSAFTTGPGVTP